MKTIFEQQGVEYRQTGDYMFPNVELTEQTEYQIGVWGHQHIAARVLPQQHCAEAAPCGGLPRSDKCVCRLHQHREQQHTRCGEAYCLVPLPSAGVFPHTLLDECDPSFGIVHIV